MISASGGWLRHDSTFDYAFGMVYMEGWKETFSTDKAKEVGSRLGSCQMYIGQMKGKEA